MRQILPGALERYLAQLNRAEDPLLHEIASVGRQQDLPLIDAEVGALLRVLAMAVRATRILEIGTAIGYSGIWLAGALPPHGMLLTLEIDADRARTARENFRRAGMADRAHVMVGEARRMLHKVGGPLDVVFLDGDKNDYAPLLDRLVDRLRPGGLLVADNVLWSGDVVPGLNKTLVHDEASTTVMAEFNERVAAHPALLTSIVPLRDGISISVKMA